MTKLANAGHTNALFFKSQKKRSQFLENKNIVCSCQLENQKKILRICKRKRGLLKKRSFLRVLFKETRCWPTAVSLGGGLGSSGPSRRRAATGFALQQSNNGWITFGAFDKFLLGQFAVEILIHLTEDFVDSLLRSTFIFGHFHNGTNHFVNCSNYF